MCPIFWGHWYQHFIGPAAMPAAKRSVCVAPEVDLGNYIRLYKEVNKAEPTLALKPKGDVTRNSIKEYE